MSDPCATVGGMLYQVGSRELFLVPGVVLTVFERPEGWRCRLRRVRVPREHREASQLEALVEWLDDAGARTGRLSYLRLGELHPDIGPERSCPLG